MKDKIKEALKTKHKGVHARVIEWAAEYLSGTVTKEEEIEGAVANSDSLINTAAKMLQDETDRRVNDALKKAKADDSDKDKDKDKKDKTEHPAPPDDIPAWAKAMMEDSKATKEALVKLQAEKAANEHHAAIVARFKEKEIPEEYYAHGLSGRQFKDDTEVEAYASVVESSWTKFAQGQSTAGMGNLKPPKTPQRGKDGVSSDVTEYLKEKETAGATGGMGAKKLNIDEVK